MGEARLTERGRRTRQRIVEATGMQILSAGIGATTLDDVRAQTLTSKSQLFHYFPGGKAELVRAVAAWEGEQLLAAQEPFVHDLSTWESWEAWRRALVAYYLHRGRWACPIGSLATQLAATDPETEAEITQAMASWRGLLAAGVARMQANGEIEAEADPQRLAAAILAAIQGGLVLSQPERSSWPLEAALDQVLVGLHARATSRATPV
ncbi:TetR/AcrR family transcriptional regulator [Aquipuribacter sp. SD81]|uniref:TetR/AcrR family transcriptional regulator n=1 Tax=Aquipuribacter sp. SD81 TaxID=3127703 RepID=UPI00301A2D40